METDVQYSDSVPRFAQKGRYAFPVGLLLAPQQTRPSAATDDRSSTTTTIFGWHLKQQDDNSKLDVTEIVDDKGNHQQQRYYRCVESFLQCEKCLKIVVVGDNDYNNSHNNSTTQKSEKKKRKSVNNVDEKEEKVRERCMDSPHCDGMLREKICNVASTLVTGPFVATFNVLENHLHSIKQQSTTTTTIQITNNIETGKRKKNQKKTPSHSR